MLAVQVTASGRKEKGCEFGLNFEGRIVIWCMQAASTECVWLGVDAGTSTRPGWEN